MKRFAILKIISTSLLFFIILNSVSGQSQKKVSTFLSVEYNRTIYDETVGNNPWGIGLGLQAFLNNKTKFKPIIDITGDIYLEDDKVLRSNPDGTFSSSDNTVRGMINIFVGSSYHPNEDVYFSFVAGPDFIGGNTSFGIKPSLGFYLSKNKKWMGKISYINIFNRYKASKKDFGSLSFSIGIKLF